MSYSKAYYHAQNCTDENDSFDIRYDSYGEFQQDAFNNKSEFNNHNDIYLDQDKDYMIADKCYVLKKINISSDHYDKAYADEHSFTKKDFLVIADTCQECNKIGYSITDTDGNIFYPENSDELKDYQGKYVKVMDSDNNVFCAFVDTYKFYSKPKSEPVTIIHGCYDSFESCDKITDEEAKEIEIKNRDIYPGEQVKKCWPC